MDSLHVGEGIQYTCDFMFFTFFDSPEGHTINLVKSTADYLKFISMYFVYSQNFIVSKNK